MYVMGNYPKCYNQVNAREYPSVIKDPRVFHVEDNKMFRQASIIKAKSYDKTIKEIDQVIAEIEELEELRKLPHDEQVKRLEESEDEDDLDSTELLRKRRLEEDEPVKKESKYSVLSYHVGSVSGDKFMQKLKGNYKISEEGDRLMQDIGASND